MQLQNYISDLLYRYQCVTIPNFGAFLTQRQSAVIHHTIHTMYPPKKVLSFNENLKHNDGLLVNYIAEVEQLTYSDALQAVEAQAKQLKTQLLQGETLSFVNIGQLHLNTNNRIVFNPSQHVNYLTNAFGLSHFTSPQIQRQKHTAPADTTTRHTVNRNATPQLQPTTKPWLKYAAAALIIGVTGFGVYKSQTSFNTNTHNNTVERKVKTQLQQKIQQATFVIPNPLPNITLNVTEDYGNYHVVGGAFRIKQNSIKRVNQLKKLGYKARLIGVNAYGLHQVVYGSYHTRKAAQNALQHIKKTNNPEAWLLVEP